MTNHDKKELRRELRRDPNQDEEYLAAYIGCSVATVRKYKHAQLKTTHVKPNGFSFCKLEEVQNGLEYNELIASKIKKMWPQGSQHGHMRITHITPTHELPSYPHGIYIEFWDLAPSKHSPPCKEAPFSFPLTYVDPE